MNMIRSTSCLFLLALSAITAHAEDPGYLGVALTQVPDGVEGPKGAIIQEIFQDSPADRDGLRSGDLIIGVNYQEIADANGLIEAIETLKSGEKVQLKLSRASEPDKKKLEVILGTRPDKPLAELPTKKRASLGIQFSIAPDGSLAVAQSLPGSAAEQAGVKPRDVIKTISGKEASGYVAIMSLVAAHKEGDEVKITVLRDGQTEELTAKLK